MSKDISNSRTLGGRLKQLRGVRNISANQLTKELGIAQSRFSYYEADQQLPGSDILLLISLFFGVSMEWLLTGKETQTDKIDPEINNLVSEFKRLSKRDKKLTLEFIRLLSKQE